MGWRRGSDLRGEWTDEIDRRTSYRLLKIWFVLSEYLYIFHRTATFHNPTHVNRSCGAS